MIVARATVETNWAGTYRYAAQRIHQPTTRRQLQALVAGARHIRALGTRHSFSAIADSDGDLVSTLALPEVFELDTTRARVRVSAGMTYARLATLLAPRRFALANLPSLPHVCVGGAVATGTHGSGDSLGSLATHVRGLQLILATGDVYEVAGRHDDLNGSVVSLGLLGVVTELELGVQPAYQVAQWALTGPSPADLSGNGLSLLALGDSVSIFTDWATRVLVLVKRRQPSPPPFHPVLTPADRELHPLPDGDPTDMTTQLGRPGRWDDRLPHFRADGAPSDGHEIQSEYFVPRAAFAQAATGLVQLGSRFADVLLASEIRSVAADNLWLSGTYGGDRIAIQFTWRPDPGRIADCLEQIEEVILPLDARPHWGKQFTLGGDPLRSRYLRMSDFLRLREDLDPEGKFLNDYLAAKAVTA